MNKKIKKVLFINFIISSFLSSLVIASNRLVEFSDDNITTISENERYTKIPDIDVDVIYLNSHGDKISKTDQENLSVIQVKFKLTQLLIEDVNRDNETYHLMRIKGMVNQNSIVGKPSIPKKVLSFKIPTDKKAEINVSINNEIIIDDLNCLPGQPPSYDSAGHDNPPFEKDRLTYNSDTPFPENRLFKSYVQGLRDHKLLFIEVAPVIVSPKSKKALVASEFNLYINLNLDQAQKGALKNNQSSSSKSYDKIMGL